MHVTRNDDERDTIHPDEHVRRVIGGMDFLRLHRLEKACFIVLLLHFLPAAAESQSNPIRPPLLSICLKIDNFFRSRFDNNAPKGIDVYECEDLSNTFRTRE